MSNQELITPDLHVAEAGRVMMAQQAAAISKYGSQIRHAPEETAVHEMRKGIRRTFTSFKLFGPYFKSGTVQKYRRGLRKIMRRLARSRDLTVFLINLAAYNETAANPLPDLAAYWQRQHQLVDKELQCYLAAEKRQSFLAKYIEFTQTPGKGVLVANNSWSPTQIAHIGPILIYQRVAAVRAFGDSLDNASVAQLHRLRIQFKELRYSLQFFEPLLGNEIKEVLVSLKQSQEHLGNLNDADVALNLLGEVRGLDSSVAQYRSYQEIERQRLVDTYWPIWQAFDQPQWRRNLANAVATL
ncbi:MAG: CHAD domain-containing protein [Candidatus Promineifilaceae bacterium]|nr:CHAD domain-containing protein [Candidatus Promineifilaceae bacterium]